VTDDGAAVPIRQPNRSPTGVRVKGVRVKGVRVVGVRVTTLAPVTLTPTTLTPRRSQRAKGSDTCGI